VLEVPTDDRQYRPVISLVGEKLATTGFGSLAGAAPVATSAPSATARRAARRLT
jgi:hypothetical protein